MCVFLRTYLYVFMQVLHYIYVSECGHIAFVSAGLPVVSADILVVSACILVHVCTYPSTYLHVSQSVFASIPVLICTYPVCILTYPGLYHVVPCLILHLQFDGYQAKTRSSRLAKISVLGMSLRKFSYEAFVFSVFSRNQE